MTPLPPAVALYRAERKRYAAKERKRLKELGRKLRAMEAKVDPRIAASWQRAGDTVKRRNGATP